MPTSKVREIPIIREGGQRQSYPAVGRTTSPANCPPAREIPIQRETAIGSRPFGDFFQHHPDPGWGNSRLNHGSDRFTGEPFQQSSAYHSQPGFPSQIGNDFWGGRHSPLQKPYSRQPSDPPSSHHVASPVMTECRHDSPVSSSPRPEQHVRNEVPAQPPIDKTQRSVPVYVEPAIYSSPPVQAEVKNVPTFVEPAVSDGPVPSEVEMEAKKDVTDNSLHVEEPTRHTRSPSPAPPNMTPLEIIEKVLAEGNQLKAEVLAYAGGRKEKQYLLMEEMLTRLLIKLDRIESEGRDDIRKARREAVHSIQSILDLLESRTMKNVPPTTSNATNLPSAGNSSQDVSESKTGTDLSGTENCQRDMKQPAGGVDVAAVKEMVLGSEVPC